MNRWRIRDLREDGDYAQKEIAAYLGIDQRTYSNYEIGKRVMPIEHLDALADFYHTSIDYLVGRTDIEKPYPKGKSHESADT
ncbi:helix-turn-helix transcriptional regulator [Oscillibacter hominis]|uniref:Helix-turn-helix transcriptional regulator n=1 Tax=Oscillibacter hominis TaxID=2763056 RepID=A0A7G9B3Y0_9FIRM|nr:helix-turn-helix transcriptional regulator [Oscillibacter hominis]QNL44261.1 helix-turn-helix transcriptional regulator [Oscillibacter hominis]